MIRVLQVISYACNFEDRSVWTSERVHSFVQVLKGMQISMHQIDFPRNPCDVLNYAYDLINSTKAQPKAYWLNTSGNDKIRRLIEKSNTVAAQMEIENLIDGQTIRKEINDQLTHAEIDQDIQNLWSLLPNAVNNIKTLQIADKISHGGLLSWNKKCELPGFFSIAEAYSF